MKLGVLGATGMLGHHCARAAETAGHEVEILHRAGSDLSRISDLRGDRLVGDLSRPETLAAAIKGLDCLVHAAAYYPTIPRPWREDVRLATEQSVAVIEACRAAGVPRLVYVGGAIALRRDTPGSVADESAAQDHAPADTNPYVQCKWAMDRLFVQASDAELQVSIAIPSMTFGEFDFGPTTGQLLTRLANGQLPNYVRGNRNVIYAGDAGRGILAVAERGRPSQRYLLTGTNTSMDELVAMAAELTAQPVPKPVPLPVAKVLSRIQALRFRMGGAEPQISSTAIAVMSSGQHLCGDKAAAELGYKPEYDLRNTLGSALAWFRMVGYIPPL